MFRRTLRAVNARFINDEGRQLRTYSLLHRFALTDGDGNAGGGGTGGGAGDPPPKDEELPIEQQLGAVKSKNRELLGKISANKPLIEFAKGLGITDVTKLSPAKLEKLKAAMADDDANDGKPDAKQDARIKALTDGHTAEVTALKGRETVLATALDKALRKSAATDAITAEGGNAKLLSSLVDQHVKLVEDTEKPGEFSVVVVDDKGNVRYGKGGKELTPREYVAELKASGEYDGAFKAPASNGGGSNNGGSSKGGGVQGTELIISADDARDTTKYRAARARAEKEGLTLKIGA